MYGILKGSSGGSDSALKSMFSKKSRKESDMCSLEETQKAYQLFSNAEGLSNGKGLDSVAPAGEVPGKHFSTYCKKEHSGE